VTLARARARENLQQACVRYLGHFRLLLSSNLFVLLFFLSSFVFFDEFSSYTHNNKKFDCVSSGKIYSRNPQAYKLEVLSSILLVRV